MKPQLKKILCPNKSQHPGVEKILAIYSERIGRPPTKLWVHCDCKGCRWIEIRFNRFGGCTAEIMPENVGFNVTNAAIVVTDNG